MQIKSWLPGAVVAALAFAGTAAQAASITVDISGFQTFSEWAEPGTSGNSELFVNIGAGSIVTGYDYSLTFESISPSWQSEFTLSVSDYTGEDYFEQYLDWAPSDSDSSGVFTGSGSWLGATGLPGPFGEGESFTTESGDIWVGAYEAFYDGMDPDAVVSSGSITIFYTPVPEPATYGLMALGLLAIGAKLRRRA